MTDDLSLDSLLAEVRSKRPELQIPSIAPNAFDPVRRRWLCVMHLLGASFSQLGKATQRRAQSINKSIDKELPVAGRAAQRLSISLSYEALSWYTDKFYEAKTQLMMVTAQQAAQWLRDQQPYIQGE